MSDLNEHLDQAFRTIEPGPAPVEAAMERGAKIRARRRAAVLAGSVAVIAAVIAGVPVLAHQQALPGPSTSHVRVTVNPPGPHAPSGTIASGLIGSKPWSVRVESPHTKNCMITGTGLSLSGCSGTLPQTGAPDPIALDGMSGGGNADGSGPETFYASWGTVRKDVTSVRVLLADGTVLTPRPVTLDGTRWVAFATPVSVPLSSLTVYSRTGEIATAFAFNGPSGHGEPVFAAWLRPGQAGQPRVTKTIASGTAAGRAWQLTAYIGPWGTCIAGGDGQDCYPSGTHEGTAQVGSMSSTPPGAAIWGTAAADVSYLIVTPKGGAATRIAVTAVGQQKYFACYLSHEPGKADRWTAYNSAGQPVASGSF